MNKELIRQEYITEVESCFKPKKIAPTSTYITLNNISEKCEDFEKFADFIMDRIHDVLKRNNVVFNSETEKKELFAFLEPTAMDLINKYIIN